MPMAPKKKSRDTSDGSTGSSLQGQRKTGHDPIAIIGIGCRYPGISSPEEMWQTLIDGKEVVGPYPGGRFAELDALYEQARRKPGRILTDRGGFLKHVDGFDALFFGISPRESLYLDPQHRLLLEVAWEALEDAGQVRQDYVGSRTGVYAGLWASEYQTRLHESASAIDFYSVAGCEHSGGAARVSFAFGLQGPSLAVDTACSSSLMAVHLACQALWAGEIDMALAGGSNIILGCEISERFTLAKMLSPEGRCKFGDASADGFVRGEGAGIVVLKRLARAIADQDPIYAVIRGSASTNDGRSNVLESPSIEAQERMLLAAWEAAEIDPRDLLYIEMHGTGTPIGDRVEMKAVSRALSKHGVIRPCLLGSVKTNIGHAESAAGVAGLIKGALVAKHRFVAKSLNVTVPTPKVAWKRVPMKLATEPVDLSAEPGPILVGVSSFGLGGTNVHLVLEAVEPVAAKTSHSTGPHLLPVSAKTPETLEELLRAHLAAIESGGDAYPVEDVCYTAGARRTHHEFRAAIVGESRKDLRNNLAAAIAKEDCAGVVFGRAARGRNKIVFVAPGQGSQWLGMARELFDAEPVFRRAFEQCDAAIAEETGWRLSARLLGADAERYLAEIDVIQPALFTMSVALAAVWRAWGVEPDAIVGHSMGEVAAAHIAGILSLEDAVAVICRRSRLMKTLSSDGSMATVELPLREVELLLAGREGISVGASNGPETTVISGDSQAIEALLKELEAKEVYCRLIKVDVASHSAQVDPILEELFRALANIRPQPGKIPMLSTVTGEYAGMDGVRMDARYWVENLRRSVLFAAAIERLAREGHDTFVELSPHPVLLPAIEASARMGNADAVVIASLRREKPARATLLRGLASLYAAGRGIAWERLYPEDACSVKLPQYPFQRKRYWPEPMDAEHAENQRRGSTGPLLGRRFELSLQPGTLVWESQLEIAALPYLNDHRVLRSAVFPVSGLVAMVLAAVQAARPGEQFELRDAAFLNAIYLPDTGRKAFQLALIPEGSDGFRFELRGHTDQAENQNEKNEPAWTLHSSGVIQAVAAESVVHPDDEDLSPGTPVAAATMPIEELKRRCPVRRTHEEQYERTARSGLNYGPAFQLIEEAWVGEQESLCRVRCDVEDGDRYAMHPALLDACFQAMAHIRPEHDAFKAEDTYLPVAIEKIRIRGTVPDSGNLYTHARLVASDAVKGTSRANLRIADADGRLLVDITGMEVMRVARESLKGAQKTLYTLEWIEEKLPAKAEATLALVARVPAENWVILADCTGVADAMKFSLEAFGGRCTMVRAGRKFRKIAEREFEIDSRQAEDLRRVLDEVAVDSGVPTAVIHLWTLDGHSTEPYDAERLMAAQTVGSQHVPSVVQAIAATDWPSSPRLWLVTAGVMTAGESDGLSRMENSPMWGVGRSIVREHAELRTTLVDLSLIPDPAEARALVLEICAQGREDRIALRGNAKYVARLVPLAASAPEAKARPLARGEDYRLEISSTGILDNIELRVRTAVAPKAGEITVAISEAGLNFNDLMKVMGLYPGLTPGLPIPLGNEAVGRVTAIGEGVEGFCVGDAVIALTPRMQAVGMMTTSVTIPAELAVRKPDCLTDEQAATIAIVYLTAYWSLIDQARLRKGEWILIHAGAGGVGLAAIEIAKWIGAKIIVTVGSPEKETYMRSLGIEHVLPSRSLSFAVGLMDITAGRGVDVVLNSLAGEFLLKSMEVLAPYGRFVELGKRDVHGDSRVGLKVLRNNNSFHVVDVAAGVEDRRPYIAAMLTEVMRHIAAGEWAPLPVTSFSSADPSEAFRFMAQGRQIGKISIRMDRNVPVLPSTDGSLFSRTGAYLISGGLGGVALTVAEWMAENGAGHLVLLSRRPSSSETDAAIRKIEAAGATVTHARADVTREDDLAKVVEDLHARGWSIKGVMHAAAVVDDALIRDVTPERFLPVMAPKIAGAWNLYAATEQEDLDFFVLFSSIAAIHPQPGMGSYAAANAFLDSFAHYLRGFGTPAISVNWGGWDRIGLLRAEGTLRSVEGYTSEGLQALSGEEALAALRRALESKPIQMITLPMDADRFVEFHGASGVPPVFAELVARAQTTGGGQSNRSEILAQLSEAGQSQRREILEAYLEETLGRVLKLGAHRIDRERPLGTMGLDSLMGLEFVRRLSNALETAVPATVVFNYPTIRLLAAHLLRRMQLEPAAESALDASAATPALDGKDRAIGDLAGDVSEEEALQSLIGNGSRSS